MNMKQKMVVTNLRIPEPDWVQVKIAAATVGMSANRYVLDLLRLGVTSRQLGMGKRLRAARGYRAWRIFATQAKKSVSKPMGASEDDKVIYGLK